MSQFRPSLIAAVVTSALASSAAANAAEFQTLSLDRATVAKAAKAAAATNANRSSKEATVSGMKSQFDAKLNKTTFSWATNKHQRPEMIAVSPEKRNEFAAAHYLEALTGISTQNKTITADLYNMHDIKRGGIIARYKQRVNGIEVFNRAYNVMMDRDHNLVAGSGYFADAQAELSLLSPNKALAAFKNPANAINTAFADLGGNTANLNVTAGAKNQEYRHFEFTNKGEDRQLVGEPRAKNVYFEHKGKLVAAFYVEVQVGDFDTVDSDYYSYVIDAKTQEILFKNNLTAHHDFTYRVWADTEAPYAPWDGPHGNVNPAFDPDQVDPTDVLTAPLVSLSQGPISTGDHWLHEDATETIGNNALAYVDVLAPDGLTFGDYTAEVTGDRTFDYILDRSEPEYSVNNRKASIVNLFYVNNFLHDDFYDNGFDEMAGNAQMDNYGRGGEEGDPLHVQAQDNSGFNNANMATPADGASPRMQMFLWTQGAPVSLTVDSHPDLQMPILGGASFGPLDFNLTANVVRIDDGTDVGWDGCESAINGDQINGNIALIDRGACSFVQKVINAQAAGAVGVLVANNRDGDAVITMGGDDPSITIPSLMVSQNEGAQLQAVLDAGDTLTVTMQGAEPDYKDSSFDNAIVSHEWGHYISNRLVGNSSGLSNNQGRAMGEGWGDFHALMTVVSEDEMNLPGNEQYQAVYGAITYVGSFYHGIRRFPYTTDMTINQHTFDNIEDSAQVHASGNVWGTMLWDSYAALINDPRHSFTEARERMKDYLVAGYKMTPNAPTYVEARDAILAAAYAYDQEDYNLILAAFARRGMGLGAIAPPRESTDHLGVVESYEVTANEFSLTGSHINSNYEGPTSGFCTNDGILDVGETGTVMFNIQNRGSVDYENVTGVVEVISNHDVTFANGGVVEFGDLGVTGSAMSAPLEFTLNSSPGDEETGDDGIGNQLQLRVTFPDFVDAIGEGGFEVSTTVNYDFVERGLDGAKLATHGAEDLSIENDFMEHVMIGGDLAKGTGGLSNEFGDFWRDLGVDMGDGSLFIRNNGFTSDIGYETREFLVGLNGEFQIGWVHYWDFEATYDGGVVEISINGEPWTDVTLVAGQFLGGGYDTELVNGPLQGRMAYSGQGAAFEAVNFGTVLNGQTVRFRFRTSTDGAANAVGWVIDDLIFQNVETPFFSSVVSGESDNCDNRAPIVSVDAMGGTVSEGDTVELNVSANDLEGSNLTYMWTQVSGPEVEIMDANTANARFVVPHANGEGLMFMVTVSDGEAHVMQHVSFDLNGLPMIEVEEVVHANAGSAVTVHATAEDPEDDIVTYSWEQLGGPSVALTGTASSSVSFTAPEGMVENNVIGLRVTATDGMGMTHKDVQVIVNRAPSIDSISEAMTVDEGTEVSLTGAASDLDNDSFTYNWSQVGGTAVELTTDGANASFTAPELESGSDALEFMLTVTDSNSNATSQNVTVTVNDVPPVVVTPPPPAEDNVRRGGGGALGGIVGLLLLPLAFMRRRIRK